MGWPESWIADHVSEQGLVGIGAAGLLILVVGMKGRSVPVAAVGAVVVALVVLSLLED